MDITVIFYQNSRQDLKKDDKFLESKIKKSSELFGIKDQQTNFIVKEIESGDSSGKQVRIVVSSENLPESNGAKLYDFKKDVLKLFNRYGMHLNNETLDVKQNRQKITEADRRVRKSEDNDEFDYEKKSKQYVPVEPSYSFERVILPENVLEKIKEAIGILECERKVFQEWGLYEIQPHPSTSLSFYGAPGTGKTMAAEAVAQKLGKKILKVSYADVESKYHGEGPKMVKAIFLAAGNEDAVLFFDEADSLLSKRLTNVSQGSEQAINSMRSQLLICLEEFRGIVIFATNLVVNYDQAFLTRLISVEFQMPDSKARKEIWDVHIKAPDDGEKHKLNIPLAEDVNTEYLAEQYEFVGREIRNAVVSACVSVVLEGREIVKQSDFISACKKIQEEKEALANAKDHTKSNNILQKVLENKINEAEKEDKGNVSVPVE